MKLLSKQSKRFLEAIQKGFEQFSGRMTPKSLEQLVTDLSGEIDEMILQAITQNELNYIDGKLKLQLSDSKLMASIELYFLNREEEWVKQAMEKYITINLPLKDLHEFEQSNFLLTYQIDSPETVKKGVNMDADR